MERIRVQKLRRKMQRERRERREKFKRRFRRRSHRIQRERRSGNNTKRRLDATNTYADNMGAMDKYYNNNFAKEGFTINKEDLLQLDRHERGPGRKFLYNLKNRTEFGCFTTKISPDKGISIT